MGQKKMPAPRRAGNAKVRRSGEEVLAAVGNDPETLIAMIRLMDAIIAARRRSRKST